jgi:3-oxoacyl-[acyl-carrier-protein] synthase-1
MGDGAAYNFLAMQQALADSGLSEKESSHERTGLIMGSGGPSTKAHRRRRRHGAYRAGEGTKARRAFRGAEGDVARPARPCSPPGSRLKAFLFHQFCLRDQRPLHRQCGRADPMGQAGHHVRGGGEELDWTLSVLFDAMGALSSRYNDTPERASRAYDKNRDGFVMPAAAAWWCSKNWSAPGHAAPRSMPNSWVTARPRTVTTWWPIG